MEIEDIYPMSDIEKGLLFHSFLDTDVPAYYGQTIYQIKDKEFDPVFFKKTFALLAQKHPKLRTGFNLYDFEEPIQMVYKEFPMDIQHVDISGMEKSAQEEYLKIFMTRDRKKGFNLEISEPLWRVRSFDIGNDNICIIWICHHAILDGWSFASLMTEFNSIYMKLKQDPGFVPAKLKNSYKEFVIEQMVEKRKSRNIRYWKDQLKGFKKQDFSKLWGNGGESRGRKIFVFPLGTPLLSQLKKRARQFDSSVKNLCFAAYLFLLYRFSSDSDIVTGLASNNRPFCEDGEKIIGCFLNLVPVREKIPVHASWMDFIKQVDTKLLELKEYERISLFNILQIIGEKSQTGNPLFDTVFNFVDFHIQSESGWEGAGKQPRVSGDSLAVSGYGFSNIIFLFVVDTSFEEFVISVEYADSVFSPNIVNTMCRSFEHALNQLLHKPEALLEETQTELIAENQQGVTCLLEAKSKVGAIHFKL
jgi:tyrocidine synthetase-3